MGFFIILFCPEEFNGLEWNWNTEVREDSVEGDAHCLSIAEYLQGDVVQ